MDNEIDDPRYLAFFGALLDGRLRLGETVTQERLCEILGLSLSPLREVLTLLDAEGLINTRRRRGIEIIDPDVRFVGNTFQFRELIEANGLQRFVARVPAGWIDNMRRRHEDLVRDTRVASDHGVLAPRIKVLEDAFHGSFVGVYDNRQIATSYARLMQKMYLLRLLNPDAVGPENTVRAMLEHLAIIDAIGAGDAAAASAALRGHFRNVLHRILAE